ncbi:hypothetical protein A1O1_09217 [Capronia coronata CBS 617.96]|uniref:N-acetyltransferase domain-containing protein n=1 Tax=Capronia coronata CBS 617.96 TaxID=1182541 RepID=W9XNA9_9EURO|nr:uncharacterized protein A1O1_09217 [Capronia coronata CBS 617.96]EXJ78815.1 hypothetical protein A1O1_09217 [Capronia coronata CBS 617.96]
MSSSHTPGIHTITSTTPSIQTILDGIVHIHASCILHDGTMATFLPPLDHATMYRWWEERLKEADQGSRHIIVYLSEVSSRTVLGPASESEGGAAEVKPPFESEGLGWPIIRNDTSTSIGTSKSPDKNSTSTSTAETSTSTAKLELEVSGVVSLATPYSQTGPFRGLVEKLFVSPLHRRKGIARAIMTKLEEIACDHGRWSLMLDTTVGTEAEHVYPRLGYTTLGVVPEYGYSPRDGSLLDEVWFWKDLRKTRLG